MEAQITDWKRYDARVQLLEKKLEAFLGNEEIRKDDRRLARVYLEFAKLIFDRLSPDLKRYLELAQHYADTGVFPSELQDAWLVLDKLGASRRARDTIAGQETDQPFIHRLLESVTRRKFAIDPITDVDPIGWMAAIGIPVGEIERVVFGVYPELNDESPRLL
jgi:hypothetical protein